VKGSPKGSGQLRRFRRQRECQVWKVTFSSPETASCQLEASVVAEQYHLIEEGRGVDEIEVVVWILVETKMEKVSYRRIVEADELVLA
jgi:hypothetical protein